jgi:hypothetical protein
MSYSDDPEEEIRYPQTIDALVSYLNDNFAHIGLEVISSGRRSVTVELPLVVHDFSSVAIGCDLEFGARVDTRVPAVPGSGIYLMITLPHEPEPQEDTRASSSRNTGARQRSRLQSEDEDTVYVRPSPSPAKVPETRPKRSWCSPATVVVSCMFVLCMGLLVYAADQRS